MKSVFQLGDLISVISVTFSFFSVRKLSDHSVLVLELIVQNKKHFIVHNVL